MDGIRQTVLACDWADLAASGLCELADARYPAAAECWLAALAAAGQGTLIDPERAACLSNAGVACAMLGRRDDADAHFHAADHAWERASRRGEVLDVALAGRSSSFHFRLAARHTETFAGLLRARLADLCAAAGAITRFNSLVISTKRSTNSLECHASDLREQLSETFGPRCPEARLLAPEEDVPDWCVSNYSDKAHDAARGLAQLGSFPDEAQRYALASALTVLLVPGVLRAIAV